MVDILTDDGVFLDLDPDAEFELTIENPMLQEDRIPVPFSTAISFLPTHTNKAVFGYLDTMMLESTVREVAASILGGEAFPCMPGRWSMTASTRMGGSSIPSPARISWWSGARSCGSCQVSPGIRMTDMTTTVSWRP